MKKLVLFFLVFLAAIWLGLKIQAGSGYVFVSYQNFSAETTLWVALLILLLGFIGFYFLLRILRYLFTINKRIHKWQFKQKQKQTYKYSVQAIKALVAKRWGDAEYRALLALKKEPHNFIARIVAIYVAHKCCKYAEVNKHFSNALKFNKAETFTINLAKVGLAIEDENWHCALESINKFSKEQQNQAIVLKYLMKIYCNLEQWEKIEALLPNLKKRKALDNNTWLALQAKICYELFKKLIANKPHDVKEIEKFWRKKLTQQCKADEKIILLYVEYHIANAQTTKAEVILRKNLEKNWDKALLKKYAEINSLNAVKQLKMAEKWLEEHNDDVDLLLCLGDLCVQQKLWGKAQHYFNASIKIKPTTEAYLNLAKIAEMQHKTAEALRHYHNIVELL